MKAWLKVHLQHLRHHPKVAKLCHHLHDPLHCGYFAFVAIESHHLYGFFALGLLVVTIVLWVCHEA